MLVSPVNIKALAYTLDLEGYDSASVLAACGLPDFEVIAEDGPWMPLEIFARMLEEAALATGDPHFGLIAGKSLGLMRYGAIVPLVLSSPNMRQLMADMARFGRLSVERVELLLHQDREGTRLHVEPVVTHGTGGRLRAEMIMVGALQLLRLCGANAMDILDVELTFNAPQPDIAERYLAAFGPRIMYGQPRNCVHFDPRLLDMPLPMHNAVAYTAAVSRAEALLSALRAGNNLAEEVRIILLSALPQTLSVADTATRVKLNERQLRRQLALLKTSHDELLQECQHLKATRLMAEGNIPLKQVALEIGFSSIHTFHRAFKRWTGITPSMWKQD